MEISLTKREFELLMDSLEIRVHDWETEMTDDWTDEQEDEFEEYAALLDKFKELEQGDSASNGQGTGLSVRV